MENNGWSVRVVKEPLWAEIWINPELDIAEDIPEDIPER